MTKAGSPDFVALPERIAVFDNDGTLWSEQPMYVRAFFAFDRVKALAPQHPDWKDKEPFASILKGDLKTALAGGEKALLELVMATHTGMTSDEFEKVVSACSRCSLTSRPTASRPSSSPGGIEFMRPWTEGVYGVPPEQVVGSSA